VEITYKGQKYVYDKWYTKPQHLAQVVFNVLNASSQKWLKKQKAYSIF